MKHKPLYTISVVSEMVGLHPQTIRQYEKIGFLAPYRTEGNTRLYSEDNLEQLRLIVTLTKEKGVNIAGVEVILKMAEQIDDLKLRIENMHRRFSELPGKKIRVFKES